MERHRLPRRLHRRSQLEFARRPRGDPPRHRLPSGKLATQGTEYLAWSASSGGGNQQIFRDAGTGWLDTTTDLTQPMRHLVWIGVRYVSVGPAGAAATSTDGLAWTPRTTGVSATLEQVSWTGSLAVAIGAGGTIITSPNGATWTTHTNGTTANLTSLAAGSGHMIAVGKGGVILRSTDGQTWTVIRAASSPVNVTGLAWTGASAVAVANPHATLTSPDGITWTQTAGPTGPTLRTAAGAGRIIAADNTTGLWTAPADGSSWTNVLPAQVYGTSVLHDGQQFVALTQWHQSSPAHRDYFYITRSADGITWTPRTEIRMVPMSPVPAGQPINDLLYTGSKYLSIQRQSTNAITWTAGNVPEFIGFLLRTGSSYLAVSDYDGRLYTSPTGETWPLAPVPGALNTGNHPAVRGIIWTGYRLLAAGSDGLYESGTGRPWTKVHPTGGVSIAWTGTRALVSTGTNPGPAQIFSVENPDASLPPTWRYWQEQHFTPAQLANPAVSGPDADADGDAYANVIEFMAASSPVSSQDSPWITVLPPQGAQSSRFQWIQDTGRNGVTVVAEVSSDLDLWDLLSYSPIDGTAGGLRTMQATAPASLSKAYFRLRVTLNE